MKNWLCDICGFRWEEYPNSDIHCPKCKERFEIRITMSREEADKIGLTKND